MDDQIELIEFTEELKQHIKTLNYEWLEKYFKVEKGDEESLSNPTEQIINKGGYIFYVKLNGLIVGTASLLRDTDQVYQLGKMAVTEQAQGYGIGQLLLTHCLQVAKEKSIQTLYLYSNTSLASAIHLYKKYGFVEVPLESGLYERANIKMEIKLSY
ncbi:MAG: Transcriptional regulator, MarR family [Cytophagaceae bacterium]|jgi:ribosomal protein S18 acetylase RimI-like enzyme|nr:Transcriptional regulator, MarR family [Cytophagaceae bacterium]